MLTPNLQDSELCDDSNSCWPNILGQNEFLSRKCSNTPVVHKKKMKAKIRLVVVKKKSK